MEEVGDIEDANMADGDASQHSTRSPSTKRSTTDNHLEDTYGSERVKRARTRDDQVQIRHLQDQNQQHRNVHLSNSNAHVSSSKGSSASSVGNAEELLNRNPVDPIDERCGTGFQVPLVYGENYQFSGNSAAAREEVSSGEISYTRQRRQNIPVSEDLPTTVSDDGDSNHARRVVGQSTYTSAPTRVSTGSYDSSTSASQCVSSVSQEQRGSHTDAGSQQTSVADRRTTVPVETAQENQREDPLDDMDTPDDSPGIFGILRQFVSNVRIEIHLENLPNDLSWQVSTLLPLFFIVYWLRQQRWYSWLLLLVQLQEYSYMREMSQYIIAMSNGVSLRKPRLFYGMLLFALWRVVLESFDNGKTLGSRLGHSPALQAAYVCLRERLQTVFALFLINGCLALLPGKTSGIMPHQPISWRRYMGNLKRILFFAATGFARLWVGYRTTAHWLELFREPLPVGTVSQPVCPVEHGYPFFQSNTCPMPASEKHTAWIQFAFDIFERSGPISFWGIAYLSYKMFWFALTAGILVLGLFTLLHESVVRFVNVKSREFSMKYHLYSADPSKVFQSARTFRAKHVSNLFGRRGSVH
eukprot:gb/GECG01012334.1/.p1 GENE.gb/GECG01012334.1/~~gb/GECG01012334.1/.p1  ORF type:complete len:584 (+),score=59.72 gb/GECG01012334.1/:1-1752(+)